ncbi:DUF2293 domain-containing protein [Aspergillus undulatus]|uniref:DUF2293 domain-containing protein n=1 Tax=Aspergillus undulatus TaxID=1810928 RepID=UPI003CCCB2D6
MTRVTRRSASIVGRRSPIWIAKRKARKHKVILESVTQAKKKLRSVISFEAKAPPGYTFISAGDPHFTTTCKELCRKDGLKVYAVSTTPHLHTHGLSQHVHRIGYHFPSAVVADVCSDRGLYLTGTGKAVSFFNMNNDASSGYTDSTSQITINTEARDVLKDLFPNIPDNDLNQIIKTAFQKGQRKVGTAVELPLARRAQLAVVAHIRHIYTNYDCLLKTTSFHEARATVEQPTLAKLVEWRGDDENGKTVLEDVFREVIVISDDDDSDIERDSLPIHGRDTSVEVISSNPVIEELQMRPINHDKRPPPKSRVELYEDDAAPGFRFVPESPKKTKIDRRGFSRYQAWDRAINKYRNTSGSSHRPPQYLVGNQSQGKADQRPMDFHHSSVNQSPTPNQKTVTGTLSRPPFNPVAEHRPLQLYSQAELSDKRRDTIAPLNSLNPVSLERAPPHEPLRRDMTNGPVFVSGPRESHDRKMDNLRPLTRPADHLHSRSVNQQDRVLPSIESPLSVEIKRPASGHMEHLAKRMSGAFTFRSITPHPQAYQANSDLGFSRESAHDRASKRRRMAYPEPVSTERPHPTNGPTTLSTHPGNPYGTAGSVSIQNGIHSPRNHVVPTEPIRIAEHEPGSVPDSSIPSTRSDREPQMLSPHGHIKAYDAQPFSHSRFVDPQVAQNRYPGQPRMVFDAGYTVATGNSRDRIPQHHSLHPTERRMPHNGHVHDVKGMRTETRGPPPDPAWWSRDTVSYKPAEKHKLYADGFVRPVDIREPGPMEYPSLRRLPSSPLLQTPPRPFNPGNFHGAQHRCVPSDSVASGPFRGRFLPDSPAKASVQQFPVTTEQNFRRGDEKLLRTTSPIRPEGRQPDNALASRYGHKEDPVLIEI